MTPRSHESGPALLALLAAGLALGPAGPAGAARYGTTPGGTHYAAGANGAVAGKDGSWGSVNSHGETNHGTYGTTADGAHYATGAYGGAAVADNGHVAYGNEAYHGGAYAGAGAYHPPAVVNQYYGAGCYNCGGWHGGAAVAGAAVAGAAVGAAVATSYAYGATYAVLPGGCAARVYGGVAYYYCGTAWFRPYYGANGAYYRVVAAPG